MKHFYVKGGINTKIHDYLFYIKEDKWDEFLQSYQNYGFSLDSKYVYPQAISRPTDNDHKLLIHISKPCINMWDQEDKNGQREIWLWKDHGGTGHKQTVKKYIRDLIYAGYVDDI